MSQIYFWNKTLHVSDSSSVHLQEFFTVHTAMVYVIQFSWQLATQAVRKPDGQRYCPKHVESYSKNKFEKWVHLVGVIIRIYHDARSPERQIQFDRLRSVAFRHPCFQISLMNFRECHSIVNTNTCTSKT